MLFSGSGAPNIPSLNLIRSQLPPDLTDNQKDRAVQGYISLMGPVGLYHGA